MKYLFNVLRSFLTTAVIVVSFLSIVKAAQFSVSGPGLVFGADIASWLAAPNAANFATAQTGETGTGAPVLATSPTLITPVLGAATGTSLQLITSLKLGATTIGALPTCDAGAEGTRYGVTDALLPAALAAVAAGGAIHVPVYCNGTTWIVM